MARPARIADLGEFGLIGRIERIAAARFTAGREVRLGIGDDAALLRPRPGQDLVVTTDALVEDVHFRFSTQSARGLGRRALAVNLSDLAAMGARPLACLLSLAAPASSEAGRCLDLVRGLVEVATQQGCPLVGGNVSRARETSITVTALGSVRADRALTRSAARPGDGLYVTGTLGGAALALARGERERVRLRRTPVPRLEAGRALARLASAGACIDVSDGLLADLGHVLEASQVGASLDADRLPTPRGFGAACRRLDLEPGRLALEGGEDYELLFTVRPRGLSMASLAKRLGVRVTRIGVVTAAGLEIRGDPAPGSSSGGWRHF
jgi:thiamine-monophosphate kinase